MFVYMKIILNNEISDSKILDAVTAKEEKKTALPMKK